MMLTNAEAKEMLERAEALGREVGAEQERARLRDACRALARSDRAAGELSAWGRGGVYALELVARYIDREPAAVRIFEGADAADASAMLIRGEDPEAGHGN